MSNWKLAAGVTLAALAAATCEKVPLTAAPGTTLTLIANPTFVAANGGRSLLTAILIEQAGTFVPDGTEVFFFTDLGTVADQSAKTVNGVARTYFIADSLSGDAHVQAISGGPAAAAPSASASPGGGGTGGGGVSVSGGTGSDSKTITVGSANPKTVVLSAGPQRIIPPGRSSIVANVFDGNGNPVRNVPIIFTISGVTGGGDKVEETLGSGGTPQFTDSNGQAFDTLISRAPTGDPQKIVTVTAVAPNGSNASVTSIEVYIN